MRIAVLDIGGTSIKSGIWDGRRLTCVKEQETRAFEGGQALMRRAADILRSLGAFEAIGFATAGQVDVEEGCITYANPNLPGYSGLPVRGILEEAFHVPVAVENDANAAAIGEMCGGAAKGASDFLCLTYGTGVGGAIVLNREIYHGSRWGGGYFGGMMIHSASQIPPMEIASRWAGTGETPRTPVGAPGNSVPPTEIASRWTGTGETPRTPVGAPGNSVPPTEIASRWTGTGETPRTPVGAPGNSVPPTEIASRWAGTYERCASVTALVRRAREVDASLTDGRKIFDAFEHLGIRSVIDAWIDEVVYGLLSLVHIFDPQLLVLGGGIMEQPYVMEEVRQRTLRALEPGFREVRIETARLGNAAGLRGAAVLAGRLLKS